MVTVDKLTLMFADRALFDEVSYFIGKQDRIGLAGRNGAGKSTMLKMLAGQMRMDSGSIEKPKDLTIGYLPQQMEHELSLTARQVAMSAFKEASKLNERLHEVEKELMNATSTEQSMSAAEEMANIHDTLNALGAADHEKQAELNLVGIGFSEEDMDMPLGKLSGGWRMRAELARILLRQPDLLLLDEPTNHLDLPAIQWLEDLLASWPGAMILISHDKVFLDRLTTRTLEVIGGRMIDRKVPWSQYVELRKVEREQQAQSAKEQQRYVEHTQELINKFRAKKNKAAFAQSLIKKLDKMERIEVDDVDARAMLIKFPPAPRSGKIVAEFDGVSKAYGDRTIVRNADLVIARGEHLALVGANGTGKTTMLRMMVGEEPHKGEITLGHNVILGYYAQDMPERLDKSMTVLATAENAASEDNRHRVRAMLGAFLFSGDDADKFVSVLSGGERARLALCCLLLRPLNFLVLDEPTHHLDIQSKDVIKQALKNYDGTFLLVSHDRDFLHGLTDRLLELEHGRLRDQHHDISELLARKAEEKTAVPKKAPAKGSKGSIAKKSNYMARKDSEKRLRKLQNKVKRCEKEVAELETKQRQMEKELAEVSKTDLDAQEKGWSAYSAITKQIEALMTDWEEAASELEEIQVES